MNIHNYIEVLGMARAAGELAARAEVAKQKSKAKSDGPFGDCGTAYIVLKVDRRKKSLAKFLDENPEPTPGVSIKYYSRDKEYVVNFRSLTGRQEEYIQRMAEEAALKVIEQELGLTGSVISYSN